MLARHSYLNEPPTEIDRTFSISFHKCVSSLELVGVKLNSFDQTGEGRPRDAKMIPPGRLLWMALNALSEHCYPFLVSNESRATRVAAIPVLAGPMLLIFLEISDDGALTRVAGVRKTLYKQSPRLLEISGLGACQHHKRTLFVTVLWYQRHVKMHGKQ